MGAESVGFLLFLVAIAAIAVSINYLRHRRARQRTGGFSETSRSSVGNTGSAKAVNSEAGSEKGGASPVNNSGSAKSPTSAAGSGYLKSASSKSADASAASTKLASINKTSANNKTSTNNKTTTKAGSTRPAYTRKYRAVGIRPRLDSCRAVLEYEDKRFLAEDAPHFPVPGCNAKNCRCQYIYYPDRRDEERRELFGAARNWRPQGERRRRDRRRVTT